MAKQIQNKKPDWGMVLKDRGVTVAIVCHWYKGQIQLSAQDLDMADQADTPEFRKLVSLGRKLVIPKAMFDRGHRIETRARAKLDQRSFDTPFGSFVPYGVMPMFEQEITEIEEEFREYEHDMIKNYSKHRAEVLADYNKLAKKLFTNGNSRLMTARLLRAVRRAIPMRSELPERYQFSWTPYHIQTPSELVRDQKKAEVIREGNAVKYRINKELGERYAKKSAAAMDAFVASSVKQMRGVVNELVVAALKSIDKNDGVVVPRISTTLKNAVENFKLMNCFGDDDIEKSLGKLKGYLADTDGDGAKRAPQVKEMLKDLRMQLKEKVSEEQLSIRNTRKGVEL